jgi:hypothetical protein
MSTNPVDFNTNRLLRRDCSPGTVKYTHMYPGGITRTTEVPEHSIPTLPYQLGAYYNPYGNVGYMTLTPSLNLDDYGLMEEKQRELETLKEQISSFR